jgi:hypothetical protein
VFDHHSLRKFGQHACFAGGELFEQLSAKGHYRERDAAHIMRTLLQVRYCMQEIDTFLRLVLLTCLHDSPKTFLQ